MIRIISLLVGLFFSVALLWSFGNGAYLAATEPAVPTVEATFNEHPKPLHLASDGLFGHFDKQQLQRGFQVYSEVCAACHSLRHVSFRDLKALGYNDDEVKAIAAKTTVNAADPLTGELKDRPAIASDHFPKVAYAGKGSPPDLSLITKARAGWYGTVNQLVNGIGGPQYVYSVLTGYEDTPAELAAEQPEGKSYNPYFASGHWIGMPAPLSDDQVTYDDGTKATVDQMAQDVSAFLAWTAEPKMEERKRLGFMVMIFLGIFALLLYLVKKKIWAGVAH